MSEIKERCFACGKVMSEHLGYRLVDTRDGQVVFVGPDCFKKVLAAGEEGYKPPRGGPRLFLFPKDSGS